MAGRALRALPFIVALAAAAALAVPVIQVTVQQLGAGYSDVLSPVGKAWVNHVFKVEDLQLKLDAVKVKFDRDLPEGAYIRVELRDCNGETLASGEVTLERHLHAGEWLCIDLTPDLGVYGLIQYQRVVLVVAGAEVGT